MHLDAETLRAYLDHQLDDMPRAADHLNACAECRARLDALQTRALRVNAHLAALNPSLAEAPRDAQIAYAQFAARQVSASEKEKINMLKTIFAQRFRPVWIGVCALVLLTVAFSFPPVRAWAGDLLAQFRVQKITVIPVDNTSLTDLMGNTALAKQVGKLLSDSVNVTKEPGKPQIVPSVADANKLVGFNVRLPSSRKDTPQIVVEGGTAFDFVVNRARTQQLLTEAGAGNLQLPASLDGAKINVNIPAGVSLGYGDCPKPNDTQPGSAGRRYVNCILVVEIPSPTIDTPPNLDVQQLAELGLQFSGMTQDQARAFSQKIDWTSTLVIPIPRNAASYKDVSVDGTTGYLIQRPADDVPQYMIVWVKNGIIYAVGGLGSDTTQAMQMANSLQ